MKATKDKHRVQYGNDDFYARYEDYLAEPGVRSVHDLVFSVFKPEKAFKYNPNTNRATLKR